MNLTGTSQRSRRPLIRSSFGVVGIGLVSVILGASFSVGHASVAAIQVPVYPQLDAPAEAALADAESLLGGRPYQLVVIQGQNVLLSASSSGTSLTTPVALASVSKAITAMVVMRLVEEGQLTLDRTMADILPSEMITEPWRDITVKQLLAHQSGFGDDRTRWFNSTYSSCFDAFVNTINRDKPSNPGTYQYSNTNFCALSLIINAITDVSYEEAAFRYVFRPLGISRQKMNGEYVNLLGAGGWEMSALSTARLISALDPQASISPLSISSRRTMIQRTHYNYGLGVWIWDESTFGHSGTLNRARNIAVRLPSGRVVVLLTQATYPESGLDLLTIAKSIDQTYGSACARESCEAVGPDPFLGDAHHLLRQTYFSAAA